MEIKKVNCEACGAPINVPEDLEFLNCSSCGSALAVQRGEGYISLKMVKEVTSAIRDGAYATKAELQKLQITQEISMLEMQLNNLGVEIRSLDRTVATGTQGLKILHQKMDLHYQVFQILDRIRRLRINQYTLTTTDPDNNLQALNTQIVLVQKEISALNQANLSNNQIKSQLAAMNKLEKELYHKILLIKARKLKENLKSFSLQQHEDLDERTAVERCNLVAEDIEKIERSPRTPESQAVLAELTKKHKFYHDEWIRLVNSRIQSTYASTQYPGPKGLDLSQAYANQAVIQNDIQSLEGDNKNKIVDGYLQSLYRKRSSYDKYIKKLEKKNQKGEMGAATVVGVGAIVASIVALFSRKATGALKDTGSGTVMESTTTGETLTEQTGRSSNDSSNKVLVVGIVVGLAIIFVSCMIALTVIMLMPKDAQGDVSIFWTALPLFVLSLGYSLGVGFIMWFLRHRNIKRSARIWGLAIFTLTSSFFLLTSISLMLDEFSTDVSSILLVSAFCLPLLVTAVVLFFFMRNLPGK